jgi:hypothetical protein
MENGPEIAPLCPKCNRPMQPGRPKVEGYPYLHSFECWACLEVITENMARRP